MGVDDEYRAVAGSEDSADHLLEKAGPITRSYYKKRSMWASLAVGALIGAAVTFLISIFFAPHTSTVDSKPADITSSPDLAILTIAPEPTSTSSFIPVSTAVADEPVVEDTIADCGSNPEEARAKGCVFDVMMQLWTPPACYDSNLSERYLLNGNWTWWADTDASHTLSLDEMRKGEHPVIYVIQDYHKQHCIFAWEKVVRALRNQGPLIEELISYDHVMHCKHRTLSKEEDGVRGVRAPTGFTRCATYDTWTRHLPNNALSSTD